MKIRTCCILIPFLLLVSCGGGNNGTGGTTTTGACLDFSPATIPSSGAVAAREAVGSTCDRVVVELVVTDVSDLFSCQVDFTFDETVVHYDGFSTSGSILEFGGVPLLTAKDDDTPGFVSISASRTGVGVGTVDAVGQHRLIRIFFRRLTDSGSSSLAFTAGRFWNDVPEELPGVSFHGGTFVIR